MRTADAPEGVTKIVEAQCPQTSRIAGPLGATPQGGAVERLAGLPGEDQVVGSGPAVAIAEARERLRDLIHQGDDAPEPRLGRTELAYFPVPPAGFEPATLALVSMDA